MNIYTLHYYVWSIPRTNMSSNFIYAAIEYLESLTLRPRGYYNLWKRRRNPEVGNYRLEIQDLLAYMDSHGEIARAVSKFFEDTDLVYRSFQVWGRKLTLTGYYPRTHSFAFLSVDLINVGRGQVKWQPPGTSGFSKEVMSGLPKKLQTLVRVLVRSADREYTHCNDLCRELRFGIDRNGSFDGSWQRTFTLLYAPAKTFTVSQLP